MLDTLLSPVGVLILAANWSIFVTPCKVVVDAESSEPIVIGVDRVMSRELAVVVEAYCKATSNFDDTIDTISKEVEEAISADRTLGGLAKDTYVESTEIEYTGDGEQPVGYVTLTFLTNYYVQETNPDVAV